MERKTGALWKELLAGVLEACFLLLVVSGTHILPLGKTGIKEVPNEQAIWLP